MADEPESPADEALVEQPEWWPEQEPIDVHPDDEGDLTFVRTKANGRTIMSAQVYLRFLESAPAGITIAEACRKLGIQKRRVEYYRRRVPEFAAREKAIRLSRATATAMGKRAKPEQPGGGGGRPTGDHVALGPASFNIEGLEERQIIYLTALVNNDGQRIRACIESRIPWAEVRTWLNDKSSRFAVEFGAIRDELRIACEDAVAVKGAKGDVSAARMVTEKLMPRPLGEGGAGGESMGVDAHGSRRAAEDWLAGFIDDIERGNDDAPVAPPAAVEDDEPEDPADLETGDDDEDSLALAAAGAN